MAGGDSATNGTRATPQGGVFEGANPSHYSSSNPINTLIIQAGIIIIFCRLLHFPLSKMRQPKVIAEVLGGVLLGPSVFGRIPGFTAAIFPKDSMPALSAAANIGLILFLFLVGLEADFRFLANNWRIALSVGALGMIVPFALGIAIAVGLHEQFGHEPGVMPVSFGVFLLFVGVAMAITAFPVLCRILTELKLLRTKVGIIVLSAGIGNDIVGWVLLALCVALVNAGSGLAALWIILVSVGYSLFLFFAVRPAFIWLLRRTGSLQNGPSQSIVALTVLMVLASAFFTGIIGVHPMFGGFMIGLICPHDGGFAVKLTEKIEDLVSVLFLPLYFALSGLSTNLGLLNDRITWGYVVGILAVAFFGKVTGGTIAARLNGLVWRESFTIGTLMSCKGLVELIVLNIGLQAKILSTKTFTMFVVMALVTTFATTPLVSWLYPHWYQVKLEAWKQGEIDWATGERIGKADAGDGSMGVFSKSERTEVSKLTAYLRLDSLPGMLTLVSLLSRPAQQDDKRHPGKTQEKTPDAGAEELAPVSASRPLMLHGVRLTALSDRDSSVMRVAELDEYASRDPILNTLTALSQARRVAFSGTMLLSPEEAFAQTLAERASEVNAEMLLLPWSDSGAMSEMLPETPSSTRDRFANGSFSHFVAGVTNRAQCTVAVFVDNGFGRKRTRPTMQRTLSVRSDRTDNLPSFPQLRQGHHIFLPFFGSEDDRVALRLVLQLAQDPAVTATIAHFALPIPAVKGANAVIEMPRSNSVSSSNGEVDVTAIIAADVVVPSAEDYAAFFATLRDTLPTELEQRVLFKTVTSTDDRSSQALTMALEELRNVPKNAGHLVVLGRNEGMGLGDEQDMLDSDARGSLGGIAGSMIGSGVDASLLVVRAARVPIRYE